jgi:hypothetical protein
MPAPNALRRFDPAKIAYYETENWVAYYQKRWPRLLQVSVAMVKNSMSLSWPQAVYAAYLVARAEIAAAPFPDNDIPLAEQYMRRFYAFVRRVHGEHFDVAAVARLEVNWWVVHRQLFGQAENQPLVQALTDLYVAIYGLAPAQARPAAAARAEAMLYSDEWVKTSKASGHPLLKQVEEALHRSYAALRAAVDPAPVSAPSGSTHSISNH